MSNQPPKMGIRATPSESSFNLAMRDEINDKLQDTFDDLIEDKIQAIKLKKQNEELTKSLDKYKTINHKIKAELVEKNKNLNLVLNLFDIPDQISLEDLEKLVKSMKIHSDLYSLIAKEFGDKPTLNKDYAPIIAKLLLLSTSLKDSLKTDEGEIPGTVNKLLNDNKLLLRQLSEISHALGCKQSNAALAAVKSLIQSKEEIEALNQQLSNQLTDMTVNSTKSISSLQKERDSLKSLKNSILTDLNLDSENLISPTVKDLLQKQQLLRSASAKLGCSYDDFDNIFAEIVKDYQSMKDRQNEIIKSLGTSPQQLVSSVEDILKQKQKLEEISAKLKEDISKSSSKLSTVQGELNQRLNVIKNLQNEREQLSNEIKRLNEEVVETNRQKQETETMLNTTKAKLQQNENLKQLMQSEYNSSRQHANDLVEKLTADITMKSDEVGKLKSQVSEFQTKLAQAEASRQTLQTTQEATRKRTNELIDNLHQDINAKADEISKLQDKTSNLQRENEVNQVKLQQSDIQIKSLTEDLVSTKKKLNETNAKMQTDLNAKDKEISRLQGQIESMTKSNENLNNQINNLESRTKLYEKDAKASQETQKELTNKLSSEIAQKTEAIAKLQVELTDTKRKQADAANLLEQTSNQLKILQSEYEAAKKIHAQAIKDLQTESSEKTQEIGRLMNDSASLKRAQIALENAKQSLQAEYDAFQQHNGEIIETLKQENSAKVLEIAKLKSENEGLKRVNEDNGLKIKDDESAINLLKSDLENTEQRNSEIIQKLTDEIGEKNKEIINLTTNISDLSRQNTELNAQIATLKNQMSQSEAMHKMLQNEFDSSKEGTQAILAKAIEESSEKTREINELKIELSTTNGKNAQLAATIESMNSQMSILTNENDKLKKDNSLSSEQNEIKVKEINDLKEKLSRSASDNVVKDSMLQENEKTINDLQNNLSKKELAIKQLQDQMRKNESEIANMKATLEDQKATANHEIMVLKNACDVKDQQIASLNEHVSNINESSLGLVSEQIAEKQKLAGQVALMTEDIAKITAQLQVEKNDKAKLSTTLSDKQAQIESLQNIIDEQNSNIQKNAKKIAELQADIGKNKISHENEISEMKLNHAKEISDIKAEHIKARTDLDSNSKNAIELLKSEHKKQLEAQNEAAQQKLDKIVEQQQQALAEKQQEISDLKEKHQHEIADIQMASRNEIDNLKAEKAKEINELNDKHQKEISDLQISSRNEINELKKAKIKEIADINDNHHQELIALQESSRNEYNNLQNAKIKEIGEINDKHSNELKEIQLNLRNEIDEMQEQHAKEISDLNDKHLQEVTALQANHRKEYNALQSSKAREIADLKEKHHQEILDMQNNMREEISNMNAAKQKELADLKQKHRTEIEAQQNTSQAENDRNEAEMQKLKEKHLKEISDIQNSSRSEIDDIKAAKLKEISDLKEKHRLDVESIQIANRAEIDSITTANAKEIQDLNEKHHREILAMQASSRAELDNIQKTKQAEINSLMMQRQKETNESEKIKNDLNNKATQLEIENSTLKSKMQSISQQIKDTSRELSEMQNEFDNRSKIYDDGLAILRNSLEKIRIILGMPQSSTPQEIAESVDNLMKNFAKHQLEVCRALEIPKRSPLKEIRGKISELNSCANSVRDISTSFGISGSPRAISDHIRSLQGVCKKLESEVRKRDTQLSSIAISVGARDPADIEEQIHTIVDENESLRTEIDVSQMNNKSICATLGVEDDTNVDRFIDKVIREKNSMARSTKKLADLVGVEYDENDQNNSSAVVYQRVAAMQRTQSQLEKILGTDQIEDTVDELHKQSEELNSIFKQNDEEGSVVYAASSQKEAVSQLLSKNQNLSTQINEIGNLMNVQSFGDIKRGIQFLIAENERLSQVEADSAKLRQEIADIIDEPGILDTTNNEAVLAAVREIKSSQLAVKESLDGQNKLLSKALGVKGRTPESLAKAIIELRKREKETKDLLQRHNEMTFGVAKMLGIQYENDKQTYGEIELAVGKLLSSTNILKDKIGEAVGLAPSLREAPSIANEVRKLNEAAKDADSLRKVVGELEKHKQELQRIAFRPKKSSSAQTDPLRDEMSPIIHQQADELREARNLIHKQENEYARSVEEVTILKNALSSIYDAIGSGVGTPREAVYEIGRLRMSQKDLSKTVLEYQKVPIPASALSEYQKAQMAHLVAQSDKLYRQTTNLKEQVTPGKTPKTAYSIATRGMVDTPRRSPLSQRKYQDF